MKTLKACLEKGGIYTVLAYLWMMYSWPLNGRREHRPSNYLEELKRHEGQMLCYVAVINSIWIIMGCVAICTLIIASCTAIFEALQGANPGYMFYVRNALGFILCLLFSGWTLGLSYGALINKEIEKHQKIMGEYEVDFIFEKDFDELKKHLSLPKNGSHFDRRSAEEIARRLIHISLVTPCGYIIRATEQKEIDEWREACMEQLAESLAVYKKFGICIGESAAAILDAAICEIRERIEKQKKEDGK